MSEEATGSTCPTPAGSEQSSIYRLLQLDEDAQNSAQQLRHLQAKILAKLAKTLLGRNTGLIAFETVAAKRDEEVTLSFNVVIRNIDLITLPDDTQIAPSFEPSDTHDVRLADLETEVNIALTKWAVRYPSIAGAVWNLGHIECDDSRLLSFQRAHEQTSGVLRLTPQEQPLPSIIEMYMATT
jgi:hypothetical protein